MWQIKLPVVTQALGSYWERVEYRLTYLNFASLMRLMYEKRTVSIKFLMLRIIVPKIRYCNHWLNFAVDHQSYGINQFLFTSDHNFWTWNLSKSFKVSKGSDFSLVSNKNFSEIPKSSRLGLGPDEVGQSGLKVLHLWRHSQKIQNPKHKNFFFIANYKTCQVFKCLNSSLMLSAPELCSCKAMCEQAVFLTASCYSQISFTLC